MPRPVAPLACLSACCKFFYAKSGWARRGLVRALWGGIAYFLCRFLTTCLFFER